MTKEEAIHTMHCLYDYYTGDGINSFYNFNEREKEAFNMAVSDMKRVGELEAENKRLKEGIANVKAEIKKYTVVDICKVSHVLQIIKKYLGG